MGWQARSRVLEFLDETVGDPSLTLDAFAFDLDEPVVCDRFNASFRADLMKAFRNTDLFPLSAEFPPASDPERYIRASAEMQ